MSRVIVVDTPNKAFDTSALDHYGEKIDLSGRIGSPLNFVKFRLKLIELLDAADFDPEDDYVATLGRQNCVAVATNIIACRYGRINLLIYNIIDEQYECAKIS